MKKLTLGLLLCVLTNLSFAQSIVMGDGQITGTSLRPYSLRWHQCAVQDGTWVDQGILEEDLEVKDSRLIHRQTTRRPDGVVATATTFFERSSLSPVRMETRVTGPGGELLAQAERQLDEAGYEGLLQRGEDKQEVSGTITSQMYHGSVLGLPLVTLEPQRDPVSFVASMMSFDGTYDVQAIWAGSETFHWNDKKLTAVLVDVDWHHRETGDRYPPGPDASGGRFWLVRDPPPGFPYVPKYKTDSYAVEFIRETCP